MTYSQVNINYTEQQKKHIFGIVYKLGVKYLSNDMCKVSLMF